MHLQRHSRLQPALAQRGIDADHRNLNKVRRGPLQRRVYRGPLGKPALVGVLAVDVRNRPHPSKQRLHLHVAPRLFQRLIDERPHPAVLFKISGNELLGFARLNAKILRESKCRKPIDDAEVHHLGLAAVVGRHHQRRHAEHLGRRQRVDVVPAPVGFH